MPAETDDIADASPARTGIAADTKVLARSRITNGNAILNDADGRSRWVRRLRDLVGLHITDLGGPDNVSEAERSILRRASTIEVELEMLEETFAAGNGAAPNDLLRYSTLSNTMRRLFEAVGLRRRPRDITPDLSEYLADHDEGAA
jgi:hypothetical protein